MMGRTKKQSKHSPATGSDNRCVGQAVYPISRLQEEILTGLELQETTELWKSRWRIQIACRVRTGIDLKRAKRAFEVVTARHESLRMRFARQRGEWRAVVDDRHQTGVVVHDVGAVPDEELLALVKEKASQAFDFEAGPLTAFHIIRCGHDGDAILVRQHHLVTDGSSFLVLMDELVNTYLGIPLWGRKPMSFGDYLARHERLPPEQERVSDSYWESLLLPVLPMPKIGRVAKGHPPKFSLTETRPSGRIVLKSTQAGSDFLQEQIRGSQSTRTALLMSAYSMALSAFAGVGGVYLNTNLARMDTALAKFIGFVACVMPVRCDVPEGKSTIEFARILYKQFQEGLPHVLSDACFARRRFDDLINGQGGHLRQFGCIVPAPENAYGNSIAASLLRPGSSNGLTIGSIRIEPLPLPATAAINGEMGLYGSESDGLVQLALAYDPLAFDVAEAEQIFDLVVNNLQLRQGHIAALSSHPAGSGL